MTITTIMAETTATVRRPFLQRLSHHLFGRPPASTVTLPLIAEVLVRLEIYGAAPTLRIVVIEGRPAVLIVPPPLAAGHRAAVLEVVRATIREKGAGGRFFPVLWADPEEVAAMDAALEEAGRVIAETMAEIPMTLHRRDEISAQDPTTGLTARITTVETATMDLLQSGRAEATRLPEILEARVGGVPIAVVYGNGEHGEEVHVGLDLSSSPDLVTGGPDLSQTFTREEEEAGRTWAHPAGPAASAFMAGDSGFPDGERITHASVAATVEAGFARAAERRRLIAMAQDHEAQAVRFAGMRDGTAVAKRRADYAMRVRSHEENAAALRRAAKRIVPGDDGLALP